MGKQTRQSGSYFGGEWTEEKLTIIRKYSSFFQEKKEENARLNKN